jgi:hypothetical protein
MKTGDIDILMLLFSVNVTSTQISQIMEQLKGPDAGTFMPKGVYDMNEKTEELRDFAYGLLPDSNDAEKTLSKLESCNTNHFFILHNNTGLYACSTHRPSNEEVRIRLDCSVKIQADLEQLRDDYILNEKSQMLVMISMATNEMIDCNCEVLPLSLEDLLNNTTLMLKFCTNKPILASLLRQFFLGEGRGRFAPKKGCNAPSAGNGFLRKKNLRKLNTYCKLL